MFRIIVASLLLLCCFDLTAQNTISVKGTFKQDSLKIGEPVQFALSIRYPSKLQVLAPDSTFSFAPFEYNSKKFIPTKTKNEISYDSIIYTLSSFEIDSVQVLKLPAFVIAVGDCTTYESNTDTIFLKQLVSQVPDSVAASELPLKTNTNYNPVSWLFNYPLFSIIGAIALVLLVLIWIIFGKKIKRYFKLKRLNRINQDFIISFDQAIEKLQTGFSAEKAEYPLIIWKKYMETLQAKPFTTFTSREIYDLEKNEMLGNSLSVIDRLIYGNKSLDSLESFSRLKEFSQTQFHKKLEEIKHE